MADRDQGVRSRDADTAIILATLGLFHVAIGIGAVLRFWVRIR